MPLTKLQGQLIDSTTNLTANNITVSGTFVPPTGNTASRPSNPVVGTTWFNSTLNTLESWSGSIWQSAGGGLILQTVQNTSFTAAIGSSYPVNTSNGAITVTLPASPTAGQQVNVFDYAGTASSNNITINPNGVNINGIVGNSFITIVRASLTLVYVDSSQGWIGVTIGNLSNIKQNYSAAYLVVAGGGGGGNNTAGGGGAGGLLTGTALLTPFVVYSVTVGSGGTASDGNVSGSTGNISIFSNYTAIGGGGGGRYNAVGSNGGSGGGGGGQGGSFAGGSGTSGQGYNGGSGNATGSGGGGGGAGAAGNQGSGVQGGSGGTGVTSSITGTSIYYAGGGAGCSTDNNNGSGGNGGGGNSRVSGTVNLGGGGGASVYSSGNPGFGGSGVVILSIPTSNYTGVTTGSPTVTTSGSNTILKFTSSGSYTA